ncbi:MAG: hypothetical protein AAF810_17725 [Cyanobacteria bacterium P01_D01_bin.36]
MVHGNGNGNDSGNGHSEEPQIETTYTPLEDDVWIKESDDDESWTDASMMSSDDVIEDVEQTDPDYDPESQEDSRN